MAPEKGKQAEDDLLDWFTVSYRAIYIGAALVVALAAGGGYWYLNKSRVAPPTPAAESPPPTTTTARFRSIEGSVKVKTVGTFEWVTGDKSIVLKKSDLVRTSAGATAEIEFFDGTVVHVRPDSLITIEETSEDPATKQRKVAWRISSGDVQFDTARKNVAGSSTEFSTPTVRSATGELSSGAVSVKESGDTDLRQYRGSSQVETKTGQKLDIKSNEGVKVDASGMPGAKLTLPGVPTLLAPPHQAEISYIDPARSTTLLAWKEVAGATTYHVQLDYSAYFNRPLLDRRGWKGDRIEVRGLDAGKYYWHIAAIDKDDSEGAFSDFAKFSVMRPAGASAGEGPPPPLAIEALDVRTNILQIKGKTEAGATVTVNGQRIDVQPDGSFNEFITLEKPGKQLVVVRAVGLNGGVHEQKRPVVVGAF